jgi:hypothetical protein
MPGSLGTVVMTSLVYSNSCADDFDLKCFGKENVDNFMQVLPKHYEVEDQTQVCFVQSTFN